MMSNVHILTHQKNKYEFLIKDTQVVLGTQAILVQHWLQPFFSYLQMGEREFLYMSVPLIHPT